MINPSETPVDDDSQKRHVQFRINSDGTQLISQSAHVVSKSDSYDINKQSIRQTTSANGIRSSNSSYDTRPSNSAPIIRTIPSAIERSNEEIKLSPKPKRSLSRINSARKAVEEFRLHPERFLSASNRYLPLLRRQASETELTQQKTEPIRKPRINFSPPISRLSDGSDLTYDDAKSFLSEENENGFVEFIFFFHRIFCFNIFRKYTSHSQAPIWLDQERKINKKIRSSNKIDMMKTDDDEETLERRIAIAHLRDREYAHLQDLIRSNPIEQILEPFSAIKADEHNRTDNNQKKISNYQKQSSTSIINPSPRIRQLSEILHSIDSLRCSDTIDRRARRQADIEKNRAKLGVLIF